MIYWPKDKECKIVSVKETSDFLEQYATSDTIKKHERINTFCNFLVPILIFLLFYKHASFLFIFVSSFIVYDIISIPLNWFACYYLPYKIQKKYTITDYIRRVGLMEDWLEEKQEKMSTYYYGDGKKYYDTQDDINKLMFFIKSDNKFIKQEKIKEEEKQQNKLNQENKKFNDKVEILKDRKSQIKYYIDNKNIIELEPIVKSINCLIKILNKRPIGLTFIKDTLYIYIDEIIEIAKKITNLSTNYEEKYSEKLKEVVFLLEKEINNLVEKIDKSDMNDIDVSLSVLLQELEKTEKENDNV